MDCAGVGVLQRRDGAHQRALAGAVRAEQPEHVVADGERQIFERFYAVGVGLGETCDGKCHRVVTSGFSRKIRFVDRRNLSHHARSTASNGATGECFIRHRALFAYEIDEA